MNEIRNVQDSSQNITPSQTPDGEHHSQLNYYQPQYIPPISPPTSYQNPAYMPVQQYCCPQPQPIKIKKKSKPAHLIKEKTKEKFLTLILIVISLSVIFGMLGSGIFNLYFKDDILPPTKVVINESTSTENILGLGSEQASLPQIVNATKDSVVAITTNISSGSSQGGYFVKQGAGSGVIISDNGYIITNTHVLEGASSIIVKLSNNQQFNATVVGTDETTDISIIKINAEGLKPVVLGSSEKLVTGQTILVIGNPLGELGGTVTTGIISALDRELTIDGKNMNLLQISAAVNPGNSGGGLFNLNGELVGIVNAKSSGSEIEGLGFSIPIDDIKGVITQLIENGKVTNRPQIGISIIEVESMAQASEFANENIYNYIDSVGVYIVESINKDLQFGDKILAIENTTISSFQDIKKILTNKKVGDEITITVSRNKKMENVKVALVEAK